MNHLGGTHNHPAVRGESGRGAGPPPGLAPHLKPYDLSQLLVAQRHHHYREEEADQAQDLSRYSAAVSYGRVKQEAGGCELMAAPMPPLHSFHSVKQEPQEEGGIPPQPPPLAFLPRPSRSPHSPPEPLSRSCSLPSREPAEGGPPLHRQLSLDRAPALDLQPKHGETVNSSRTIIGNTVVMQDLQDRTQVELNLR